jgi:transcription elongation factor GreA
LGNSTGIVRVGSRVELQFGELREQWSVVDPAEADVAEHRMSAESALAAAILGHNVGDYAVVSAPGGAYAVRILHVA